MNRIEEIKRRIELKQQLIEITNAEIERLRDALIIVNFADCVFLQLMADSTFQQ